jgi:hypothetical protein
MRKTALNRRLLNNDRYCDVFVEYAKEGPEDILVRITVVNHGDETATLRVLPTLWFRNTWSWKPGHSKPTLSRVERKASTVLAKHEQLGEYFLVCDGDVPLLFTENETNTGRLFHTPNVTPYVKDGINNVVVYGSKEAVNPAGTGTKVAADYTLTVKPGEKEVIRLRLGKKPQEDGKPLGKTFDEIDEHRERRRHRHRTHRREDVVRDTNRAVASDPGLTPSAIPQDSVSFSGSGGGAFATAPQGVPVALAPVSDPPAAIATPVPPASAPPALGGCRSWPIFEYLCNSVHRRK